MLGVMTSGIIESINKVSNAIIHGDKASLYAYKKTER